MPGVVLLAATMWSGIDRLAPRSLVTIPGVNHLEFFQRSYLLLPHLESFLDEVVASGYAGS